MKLVFRHRDGSVSTVERIELAMRRVVAALVLPLALASAAPAARAQAPPPPTLSLDTFFAAPLGIASEEVTTNVVSDTPAGIAVHGDRIYTVGTTSGSGQDIAISARRMDGTLDPSFHGDGRQTIALAAGAKSDVGIDVAVLPNGHLRVLARTDVSTTGAQNLDVAIVGLTPDGSPDGDFGNGGKVTFPVGAATTADTPRRMAIAPDGRIAITGTTNGDVFVALRDPAGAPVASFDGDGVEVVNLTGNSSTDSGVDIVFSPGGGLLILAGIDVPVSTRLIAFEDDGDPAASFAGGSLPLGIGDGDTFPGGLIEHGGRYYVSGSARFGSDVDAFIARLDADGGGLQHRRFDMRGRFVPAGLAATSHAADLIAVAGAPDTLVAVGQVRYATDQGSTAATDWAAAAFNGLEGDLAQAGYGDVVLSVPGDGGLVAAAAGPDRSVAVTGLHRQSDDDFGNARLLVDAEKRCDLAVAVADPAEIVFRGVQPAALGARVTNEGTRPCGGTITVPAPYRMAPVETGPVAPGATFVADAVPIAFDGPRRSEDVLPVTLEAAGDSDLSNNLTAAHVVFSFCDVRLEPVGRAGAVPSEGKRRFPVTLRNSGTIACRVRIGSKPPYSVAAGQSVADRVPAGALRGARPGARVAVVLAAGATDDVNLADNAATVRPVVVGVGDSDVRRAGARGFSGTARRGSGPLAPKRLRPARVHVALLRTGAGGCAWLRSARGSFEPGNSAPAAAARGGAGCARAARGAGACGSPGSCRRVATSSSHARRSGPDSPRRTSPRATVTASSSGSAE